MKDNPDNNIIIQGLLEQFPECRYVKRSNIEALLTEAFLDSSSYRELNNKLYDFCHGNWPEVHPNDRQLYDEYITWFYGGHDSKSISIIKWIEQVNSAFIEKNGTVRTYEEACRVAADKWTNLIFDSILQDNGDKTGYSDILMLLGTYMKKTRKKELTDEMRYRFMKNMTDFYLNKCQYEYVDDDGVRRTMSNAYAYCDYYPNGPLYNVMKDSGIPEDSIVSLAPWKTGIKIDKFDNSVVYRTYGKTEYL